MLSCFLFYVLLTGVTKTVVCVILGFFILRFINRCNKGRGMCYPVCTILGFFLLTGVTKAVVCVILSVQFYVYY